MSANTAFTYLATLNSDRPAPEHGEPAVAAPAVSSATQPVDLSDPEALPKRVLHLLSDGPMTKDQLLQTLNPYVATPLDPGFFDQVLDYLVRSEMINLNDAGVVELTDFAKQALSVFSVA